MATELVQPVVRIKLPDGKGPNYNLLDLQRTLLGLQEKVALLSALVDILDPDHDYEFQKDTRSFIKHPKKTSEGGTN